MAVQIPHAVDVKRETGLVALTTAEELGLSVAQAEDVQKVDVAEFARLMPAESGGERVPVLKPEFVLNVQVAPVQAQLEAVVRNMARVSTEQISLSATVEYTIKRAGVFALRLAVPAGTGGTGDGREREPVGREGRRVGGDIEGADAGQLRVDGEFVGAVEGIAEVGDGGRGAAARRAEVERVRVGRRRRKVCSSRASRFRVDGSPGAVLGIPNTGNVGGSALAFKLIPGETATAQPGWKLAVATEQIESWVRAEVMNTITLTETLASGRSVIRYDVANAPTKEFRVKVRRHLRMWT